MKRVVITKPDEFRDWCSKLKPTWSLDTETTSLDWLDLEIIGFSICDGTQACYVDIKRKHKKELLMILDYYLSEAKMVVMHNAPYDMMALLKEGIDICI
jgi:DNA polymerase I-like protein with 3'-5' exonuclease and polymerase domains